LEASGLDDVDVDADEIVVGGRSEVIVEVPTTIVVVGVMTEVTVSVEATPLAVVESEDALDDAEVEDETGEADVSPSPLLVVLEDGDTEVVVLVVVGEALVGLKLLLVVVVLLLLDEGDGEELGAVVESVPLS